MSAGADPVVTLDEHDARPAAERDRPRLLQLEELLFASENVHVA